MSNLWSKARIAFGLTAFVLFVSIGNAAGEANATPGKYTIGGDITIVVAAEAGCATVYHPNGNFDTFCGQMVLRQKELVPGQKFGANVVSYTGRSVFCKVTDDSTGDVIKADFGYAGGAAICMSNSI